MFYQANDFVKAPNLMVKSMIVTITIIFGSKVSTVVINFTVLFTGWILSLLHYFFLYTELLKQRCSVNGLKQILRTYGVLALYLKSRPLASSSSSSFIHTSSITIQQQ